MENVHVCEEKFHESNKSPSLEYYKMCNSAIRICYFHLCNASDHGYVGNTYTKIPLLLLIFLFLLMKLDKRVQENTEVMDQRVSNLGNNESGWRGENKGTSRGSTWGERKHQK